jgi:hypothetical protein
MFYIQSGDGEFNGAYLMGFVGALPVWTDDPKEAWKYPSADDDLIIQHENRLEQHHHLCFIVPA